MINSTDPGKLKNLCITAKAGTVNDWREKVAKYCQNNPLALFAVSAAFSAPLVEFVAFRSMGFCFTSDQCNDDAVLLALACSVYGNPQDYKHAFSDDINILENLANAHHCKLLALDDITLVNPETLPDSIYMLSSGKGQNRNNPQGKPMISPKWDITYLTSGKQTLEHHISQTDVKLTPAISSQLTEINITLALADYGYQQSGCFHNCHEFESGEAIAEYLVNEIQSQHGKAYTEFNQKLCTSPVDDLVRQFKEHKSDFINLCLSSNPIVNRVSEKFALVGFAGELATQWSITGWEFGSAINASKTLFTAWQKNQQFS